MKTKYVRIPQSFTGPCKHLDQIPEQFRFAQMPDLWWGTTIYMVLEDGSLKYVKDDVDSSD